ncbi:hypothetical protein DW197_00800 [Enterobacter sp. AM17-18]|nr:hypothetical protein DW197_00800 [Enterobacter sp. AM17-18]
MTWRGRVRLCWRTSTRLTWQSATKSSHGGFGIGLSIVFSLSNSVVKKHATGKPGRVKDK